MDAVVIKKCCVCGLDVSRMRRTRDPRGQYYCQPCYQTLWEAHQRRLHERDAIDAEAAAAALLMERAVEAASAAAENAAAPEPAVIAPVVDALTPASVSPNFQIKALPAAPEHAEPIQLAGTIGRALSRAATALASLRSASESAEEAVVPVTARRVKRHRHGSALRLSDLVGAEAQSAVKDARSHFHEPEVPVSPITNLPVSALVDDYAALVEPREPIFRMPDTSFA